MCKHETAPSGAKGGCAAGKAAEGAGRLPKAKVPVAEGARNSARLRQERAKEKVQRVIERSDGTQILVYETYALHWMGARRTFIPLDLVEKYPVVIEFATCGQGGLPGEVALGDGLAVNDGGIVVEDGLALRQSRSIVVEGALKDVKHEILRRAASGTVFDEGGVPQKIIVWPNQFNACGFTFDVRLEYWTGFLDERLHRKRQKVWDAGGAIDDVAGRVVSGAGDPTREKVGCNGALVSAFAEFDEGYEMAELLDAIDAALKRANASETDVYIFKQHFLEGREYQDIAKELGKANSSMTYAMKHVVQSVREYLREDGYHA
jgi:hypothetical protein